MMGKILLSLKKILAELKKPTDKEKIIAALLVISVGILCLLIRVQGGVPGKFIPMMFSAFTTGVVLAVYGISPAKGWRHTVVIVIVGGVVYLPLTLLS